MNRTIILGSNPGNITSDYDWKLTLRDLDSVLIPEDGSFSNIGTAFAIVNWSIFTYFRGKVYKYLFKQFKMRELTSINVLTLIVCLVQHLEIVWGLPYEVMMTFVHGGYGNQIMPWFCMFSPHVLFFFWGYSSLGGLGIAIYRIMLIKHHHVVHEIIGRKSFMLIIIICQVLILSLSLGLLAASDSFWYPIRPPCFHLAELSTLDIIDVYNQSDGSLSTLEFHIMDKIIRGVLLLVPMIAEIAIYCIFFRHMYKHDNNEGLKKILEVEVVHERNRRNAMTFLSLFFSFLVETLFQILIIISQLTPFHYGLPMALRKITLTAMAIVEVITSRELNNA